MTISIHSAFTARELRNALSLARLVLRIANKEILNEKEGLGFKEDALKETLQECKKEDVQDKLEYAYRFLTHLAWLGKEVTEHDYLHFNKEKK